MSDAISDKILEACHALKHNFEAKQAENQESFKKTAEVSADLIQEINDLKQINKNFQKELKDLEKSKEEMSKALHDLETKNGRISIGSKQVSVTKEFRDSLDNYFTNLIPIQESVLKDNLAHVIKTGNYSSRQEMALRKDYVEGINPQGGYWVLPQWLDKRITRVWETSPIRQVCTVINATSNPVKLWIEDNEVGTLGSQSEQEPYTSATTDEIGELTIPLYDQRTLLNATEWMLEDAGFDLSSRIVSKAVERMTRQENTWAFVGTGANQPKGINSYPNYVAGDSGSGPAASPYRRGYLEVIHSGTAGVVTKDSLIELQTSLVQDYMDEAVFMMNRKTWLQVLKLQDSQGRPLFNLINFMATGAEQILLGDKVIFAYDIPVPAADSKSIVYGDFKSGYTLVDRLGLKILRDPYSAKPFTEFAFSKRIGGAVTNYQSLKILQLSA